MKKLSLIGVVLFCCTNLFAADVFMSLTKSNKSFEEMPLNITVINSNEIKDLNATTVSQVLENTLGTSLKSNGYLGAAKSVFIRGASSLQTLVLVDGRPINDIGLGNADLNSIPVNMIEKIEIIRGAGASIYGTSAFGGVINIITKKANTLGFNSNFGTSYGSFNTHNIFIDASYRNEHLGTFISLSSLDSDGYRKNSKYEGKNLFANLQGYLYDYGMISLSGAIYDSSYGVPGSISFPTLDNIQKDNNQYLKLDYDLSFNDDISLSASGYLSHNIRKFDDKTGNPYSIDFSESRYKYTMDTYGSCVDVSYKNTVLLGFQYWNEQYKEEENISDYGDCYLRDNVAGYVQANFDIANLNIVPTIRYDNNTQFGGFCTPSLSLVYKCSDKVKFSGNISRVWRSPAFTDLYWYQPAYGMYGNKNLKPEQGISGDIGAEYSFEKLRLMGSFFYIKSQDLINWSENSSGQWIPENIDDTTQHGFEVEAGYYMSNKIHHSLNYTFLNAVDNKTNKILTYKPESTINYTLTFKPIAPISIATTLSYKNKIYSQNSEYVSKKLNDILICNISVNYNVNNDLSFWIKGLNIGNVKYESQEDYPMAQATVYGGLTLKIK